MNLFSGKKGEALRAAPCLCKDRPELQCPGQWEPGCDLGANEAHVRVVRTRSQALRDAGFTRRPSWKSLPKDGDDASEAA
jgi:hypothetical protein